MEENRPNPDLLLQRLEADEPTRRQGALKIFFGYAAGVGKTYAMLEAAHAAQAAGVDVVAGYIEPHARPQTLALLEGLEALPVLQVKHRDISLREFDIDSAIRRKPQLILVDELAHSNAQGCRHLKRYQDIEELLKLGIDVYTTVNVQHIESLNDIVASITGVIVRERIPDSVFDSADQVELVDIEPSDLLVRLEERKVYAQAQAQRAMSGFFTKANLTSLREIALRRTADRVNKAVEKSKPISQKNDYFTGEHILICLSSSPSNAKVIRTAARMADAFHGSFTALFVETPGTPELQSENRSRLRQNLKLAEQLGAKIATVYGDDIAYQIAEYAKISGISKIVIGRSNNKRGLFLRKQSFIDRLTALAPNLDIYVIPDNRKPYIPPKGGKSVPVPVFSLLDTLKTLGVLGVATLIGVLFFNMGFSEANIVTVYILGVLVVAYITDGKLYGVVASFVSVLAFNFFFTYPYLTFSAFDPGYPVTFFIMFISSFFTSTITKRTKRQAYQASVKSYRTEVLLDTSQRLQRAKTAEEILSETARQMMKLLERDVIIYPVKNNELAAAVPFTHDAAQPLPPEYLAADEQAVATWVYRNNKHAGATTSTLPGAKCLYMAVRSNDAVFAVVGIALHQEEDLESFEKNLLIAMLAECAMALEKDQAMLAGNKIALEAKQEQLRANLLRAISHDLRTPLTSISGNAGLLMSHAESLEPTQKQQLYTSIYDDSLWLINLVENLLSVTRITNGTMQIRIQSELLGEVVEEAMTHIDRKSCEHTLRVELEDELLMARMDAGLIIQVIINIVDNAIKYTQVGSTIVISARRKGSWVEVQVADDGEGIPEESQRKLFEMFYTGGNQRGDGRRGMGIGLSLCKSIVEAHGGAISVRDNKPHGTVFSFTLQYEGGEAHE